MRRLILIFFIGLLLPLSAQNSDSFLWVDDFHILGPEHTFVLPGGMKKTDNNGKPWAMIKVVAKGFDHNVLNEISFYSPSSTLTVGDTRFDASDGSYKIIVSSGVKGKLVFKYQGTTLEYQMPMNLVKNRVYQLDLAMRSANLTIVATPADSKIYVDGEEVGENGFASVNLRLGEHNYSVECDDYVAEKNKTIKLEKNETVKVNLTPLFGYISVNSEPYGADVYVNGEKVGVTPYIMERIKRGRNNIEVKLEGFYDHAELVEIAIGEQKTLDVALVGLKSSMSHGSKINATPTLRLSEDSLYFGPEQSRDSIFITTNSVQWEFRDVPQWVSLYKRNNILYVACVKNRVHESREADITIYTNELTRNLHIYQDIGRAVLRSYLSDMIFESKRDSIMRVVETNVTNWEITTSDEWIAAYEKADTLVVVCEENTTPVSRYGMVTIKAFDQQMDFKVVQKSHVTEITVPDGGLVIEASGGTMSVPVGLDGETWSCSTDADWLNVSCSESFIVVECAANDSVERHCSFNVFTDVKSKKVNVTQKGLVDMPYEIIIDSKPSGGKLFVDGENIGRTPVKVAVDDSVHFVKFGREKRAYVFNKQQKPIEFNTGLRFLSATISGETMGMMTGFVGVKRWGGYTHFQLSVDNRDINPDNGKIPVYTLSFGPSYEIKPWMSVHGGAGASLVNDTSAMKFGGVAELGLMFYYKHVFLSGGLQVYNIGNDKQRFDFLMGLGVYFNRYYAKDYGYRAVSSRYRWSINYMYNAVTNGHGVMFGDIGKGTVRAYIKTMVEQPDKDIKRYDAGLSSGVVLTALPGYADFLFGVGYQASSVEDVISTKGIEAELGITFNVWRFPLTAMMRYCEIEQDTRYLCVDFGIGFSFGEFGKKYK